jgi:transposase
VAPSDPRDARIAELERQLALVLKRLEVLEAENAELKARLGQNSQNSSKPPSSDGPGVKRPPTNPTGRKRGGQPGHGGAERRLLSPDEVIHHRPKKCRRCSQPLRGDDPDPKRFQVLELPPIRPHVTEHRAHALTCSGCGMVTEESLPGDVLQHGFGARLSAFVAYLTGRCRLSKRQVVELCEDALGTPISLGAVCAVEQDVSEALAAPVEEALAAVRQQPVVHLDETGWREDKMRAWLWVAVTSVAIVFQVARSRGASVAKKLLGEAFAGHAVSDRWCAYNWLGVTKRQLCWAHLRRDFTGMVERGGYGGALATGLLIQCEKIFEWWAEVRDGTMTRARFQRLMKPVRAEVGDLLRVAAACAEPRTAGMCEEILKLEPALWTFVDVEGIDPTNNAAERAIRPAVLWRKGSFGNDSPAGSRFTERILTAVATVRLRGGCVLDYLASACTEYRVSRTAPSLLAVMPAD